MTPPASTGRVRLQPARLQSLAEQWRQQEWDLRSVCSALSTLDAPGFSPSISVELSRLLDAWAAEVGDLALTAGSVAHRVWSARTDFVDADRAVGDRWR